MAEKHEKPEDDIPISLWKSFKLRGDLHKMASAICAWKGGQEITGYLNTLVEEGLARDYQQMLVAYAKELGLDTKTTKR